MTFSTLKASRKGRNLHTGSVFLLIGTLFCLLLILKNPEIAADAVGNGLLLCAKSVVPSLFPFMVISELAVSANLIAYLPSRLLAPMRRALGLSDTGCAAVLLGLLCGSPIGARSAVLALGQGKIEKREAERILTCSLCPSSAFVIGALGITLLKDRRLGIIIYFSALISALLTGVLFRLVGGSAATSSDFSPPRLQKRSAASLFTAAVAGATGSILLVSAYVVFFSALMGALGSVLGRFSSSAPLSAVLFCLLELSGGVGCAATLASPTLALLLCSFAVGWSGLSVHCQLQSICEECGISLRPYLLSKLLQGVLCTLLTALSLCF